MPSGGSICFSAQTLADKDKLFIFQVDSAQIITETLANQFVG